MNTLRVGIIGYGAIARTHYTAINTVPGLTVTTVSSSRPRAELGLPDTIRSVPSTDAVISCEDVDVVVVCSPSGHHARHAIDALNAGKHVVIEKPLAVTPMEIREVEAAAAQSSRVASVISQRRFEPQHLETKRLIGAGTLGRPLLVEGFSHWYRDAEYYQTIKWHRDPLEGGGSLFNQGVHILDLMLWLFGEVAMVTGFQTSLGNGRTVEDTSAATIRFASGALGVCVSTTAAGEPEQARLDMYFERATIRLTQGEPPIWKVPGVPPPQKSTPNGGIQDPLAISPSGHASQWRDIRDAITYQRAPLVTIHSAAQVALTCAAVAESVATGRIVRLTDPLDTWIHRSRDDD